MTPGRKYKIQKFFEGSGKTILLLILSVILTAAITSIGRTFITIPMPSNYAEKSALVALSQAHAKDIEKLQIEKMDRSEYEKRHEEIKQQFVRDTQDNRKMISEMYSFLLGKKFKHKEDK